LRRHTEEQLKKCVALVNRRGYCAEYHYALGTDPVHGLERLAHKVAQRFPRAVFFAGKAHFPAGSSLAQGVAQPSGLHP
jgi:hypothetical protein